MRTSACHSASSCPDWNTNRQGIHKPFETVFFSLPVFPKTVFVPAGLSGGSNRLAAGLAQFSLQIRDLLPYASGDGLVRNTDDHFAAFQFQNITGRKVPWQNRLARFLNFGQPLGDLQQSRHVFMRIEIFCGGRKKLIDFHAKSGSSSIECKFKIITIQV